MTGWKQLLDGHLSVFVVNVLILPPHPPSPKSDSLPQSSEHGCLSYPVFLFPLSSLWRQKELQELGEIRIIQLGFDLDAHGIVFTEDYRTRVCERGGRGGGGEYTSVVVSGGKLGIEITDIMSNPHNP